MDSKELSKLLFLINEITKEFLYKIELYEKISKNGQNSEKEDKIHILSGAFRCEKIFLNAYETISEEKEKMFPSADEKNRKKVALEFSHKSYAIIMEKLKSVDQKDLELASAVFERSRKEMIVN